jgi:hypothetical protein
MHGQVTAELEFAAVGHIELFHNVIRLVTFEILNRPLVLFGGGAGLERAEIAPAAGRRILFAGIKPVATGGEFPDHRCLLSF